MKELLIFLLIIILGTIFSSKEKFKIQYLAPLNLPYGKNKSKLFSKNNKQIPWYKKSNNKCKEFRCFVNKHLQRKCEWV